MLHQPTQIWSVEDSLNHKTQLPKQEAPAVFGGPPEGQLTVSSQQLTLGQGNWHLWQVTAQTKVWRYCHKRMSNYWAPPMYWTELNTTHTLSVEGPSHMHLPGGWGPEKASTGANRTQRTRESRDLRPALSPSQVHLPKGPRDTREC